MKIEHTAYQVSDPVGLSRWYVEHLGLTVKRAQQATPFGHFLADDGGAVMLEFYCHAHLPIPDYREMDPMLLHIAFTVNDVAATRARLLAAGASVEGDVQKTESGDVVAFVRDPCGLTVQLVHRKVAMLD